MGLIEELATFLDTASTRFALGTNLFLNDLPDIPATATGLFETGGVPPTRTFRPSTKAAWENQRVQVYCRSTSSVKARADVQAVFVAFEGIVNTSLSGTTYLRVSAVQSPFLLERDQGGRVSFAVNFDVMRRL